MFQGHIKPVIISSFAVIFGMMPLICGCLSVASGTNEAVTSVSAIHQMSQSNAHDMFDKTSESHDHKQHDPQSKCSHCDNSVVLMMNIDAAPTHYKSPTSHHEPTQVELASFTRAHPAFVNLATLRWRRPPKQNFSLSPVTLHTRSLT